MKQLEPVNKPLLRSRHRNWLPCREAEASSGSNKAHQLPWLRLQFPLHLPPNPPLHPLLHPHPCLPPHHPSFAALLHPPRTTSSPLSVPVY